jgi:CheY-like chemotaxis protein
VIFPLHYHGPEEAQYITSEPVAAPGLRTQLGSTRPKVLIIDDREEDRYILRSAIVSLFECDVLEASGGADGLRVAERELPSLVFLDLSMPGMSGFDVLDRWQQNESLRKIPVAIHSAQELTHEERLRLQAAAVAILSKDRLSEEELIHSVAALLGSLQIARKRTA